MENTLGIGVVRQFGVRQFGVRQFTVRRTGLLLAGFVIGLAAIGCGSSNKPILPSNVQKSAQDSGDAGPAVAHPEYANWNRFPVGTEVTRFRVVSNPTGEVQVTTVLTLSEKSEQHVDVASQVNVIRPGEPLQENPSETTRFSANFALPKGLTEEYFQLPSMKAKKTREESMDVHGKTVKAELFEWTESNETGPMTIKLWRSNEVPGRIVRQEMLIESSQTKTVEELTAVTW
jgi:hypothetical protein